MPTNLLSRDWNHVLYMCVFTDQAIRFWLLCPSFQRGTQEEVPRGHTLLDGTRGYLKITLRDWGEDTCTEITLFYWGVQEHFPVYVMHVCLLSWLNRLNVFACSGGHLVFRHYGDWDGGRRAPLLQWAPSAGHEKDTRQPAPTAKGVP